MILKADNSRKLTLTEKAYTAIKNSILSAEIKPGDILSEGKIAEQLSVSRTPVREAIKRLESEGLVNSMPAIGTFVTKLTAKDIKDIYFLRKKLEIAALELSINNISDEEINVLKDSFIEVEERLDNIDKELKIHLFNLDKNLHRLIIEKSDNNKLVELLDIINSQIELTRGISATTPGRLNKSFHEHRNILMAIKERNFKKASKLLIEHLNNIKNNTLEINENLDKYL